MDNFLTIGHARSPEQLREAELPIKTQIGPAGSLHLISACQLQPLRSPSVQSLGDLLNIKTGKFHLLPKYSDSSDGSDIDFTWNMSEKGKMKEMISTMNHGVQTRDESIVTENISIIKGRESVDPRISIQPSANMPVKRQDQENATRVLSSTPVRIDGPEHLLELSSIHGSDAGGSMLVPMIDREMLTKERVDDHTELTGDTWYAEVNTAKVIPLPYPDKSSPPVQSSALTNSIMLDSFGESQYFRESRGKEVKAVGFKEDIIKSEVSQISPDNSARMPRSRTLLSSNDTSGEIFSAGES